MRKVHLLIRDRCIERLESRALLSSVPLITTQPVSQIFVTMGNSATFMAAASGDPAPTVQWEVSIDGITDFAPITNNPSATTDTLIVPNVQMGQQTNQYEAVFSNSAGTAATIVSTLYVEPPITSAPVISQQPVDQALAAAGDTATFTAAATGAPTPTVQWYVEIKGSNSFTPITDNTSATTPTLTLPSSSISANGNEYEAVFSNSAGTITTNPSTLSVPASTAVPPEKVAAFLTAPTLKQAQKNYFFTVTYSSFEPIDTSSFDKHNVFVTGAGGTYEQSATFINFTSINGGKSVTVTYRVTSAGPHWSAGNNGKYHVYVRSAQVKDINGNFVTGGILGPFKLLIA